MNKEIELLHNKLEAQDKIINTQALEIARLKEQLENDIDRYEDTISYQLGFDKGKEYLQQKIDKAIEEINYMITNADITEISAIKLKQILGEKEW